MPSPKKRESCTIFGAWNIGEQRFIWKSAKRGNSKMLIEFLHQIRNHYKGKKIVLIMDNASYHSCKKIRDWVLKYPEVFIAHIPPYSPEYSPVEQVWKWLKTMVSRKKVDYNNLQEKIHAVRQICWAWRENKLVKPLKVG
ncbi:MAG: IS630 family transposase, partial [Candidatus Cloacimonadaceae bacterium]|nr:IS630 family transposase [Candidatus Cloacimonadaceae bacterium]